MVEVMINKIRSEVDKLLPAILELRYLVMTQNKIAIKLNIDQAVVYRRIQKMNWGWLEFSVQNVAIC